MIDFVTENRDGRLFVRLDGDLDIDGIEKIETSLIPILDAQSEIYIDFSNVAFVDSSGIGLLIHLIESLTSKEIIVKLYNLREEVLSVFEILQVTEIIGEGIIVPHSEVDYQVKT
ncbi:STAS domain-containing protein [Alkalicoccobacillus porphyridii]|uniref:STAS domain-containing protein n=1 Tax=Alkalicoccobacillus porphyridii TaxID=2597270 RepID=A0A554A1M1_9BACI|nr:STAS domain-containing protein [Alkalicoccobacillus porphyridii]TSB47592.1 STAS domain-containing protein [Alkalicoccobacillus porphyridii]